MNNMLLSIVIPAYNAERFLHNLLSILVEQVFECKKHSIEVIIVNDGSQDSTKKIAEDFSNKYPFITVINQENKGECGARNTGIKCAKGKYLYFLDSDDTIPVGTLAFFQQLLLGSNDIDVFNFGYEVERNGQVCKIVSSAQLDKRHFNDNSIKKNFLSKKMPCCICSSIYKKDFIYDNDLFFPVGIKIGGDLVFMVNAFTKSNSAYYSKRICFIYQIRDDSVMQGYKSYNMDRIKSFEIVRDTIIDNAEYYSLVKKEANFFIANLYLANLVAYLKSNVKDKEINKLFIQNKFFLYKSIKGRFINRMAILVARCVPLRLLLKIFK